MSNRVQRNGWRSDIAHQAAPSSRAPHSGTRRVARPTREIQRLVDFLAPTAEAIVRQSAESYVGRTANPAARLLQHFEKDDRRHLVTLFWSDDIDEVQELETALIRSFGRRLKQANLTERSRGRVSLRTPWNCVYLSWSWKVDARKSVADRFEEIRNVEWEGAPRAARLSHTPQFLRVPPRFSREDASEVLKEAYPRRR